MKATKLASIFAVTAVAAAVSTTTIAAEPVFSGEAGLTYDFTSGAEEAGSEGDVTFTIDTGVIVTKLDMSDNVFVLEEAYVKQGAVSFGDFDGNLADSAQFDTGVEEGGDSYKDTGADLGIRYDVTPELTVAVEMLEGKGGFGFGAAYEADLGGLTVGASAGSYTSEDDTTDNTSYAFGVSADLGMATAVVSYSGGTQGDADVSGMVIGADLALSEELAVSVQYSSDLEAEQNNVEVSAFYTAGDIEYFATSLTGDVEEVTKIGARASF